MDKRDMQLLETGLGNVTWWGYSPSFNILDGLTGNDGKKFQNFNNSNRIYQIVTILAEENNVLLLGASDGRHLFETISMYNNEEFPKLTFW